MTPTPASDQVPDGPPPQAVVESLLEAAVSLALLDARAAVLAWGWPHGTELRGQDGQILPFSAVVAQVVADLAGDTGSRRLRTWLGDQGVDSSAPLWLAGGAEPSPERSAFAFEAYRGCRPTTWCCPTGVCGSFAAGRSRVCGKAPDANDRPRQRPVGRDGGRGNRRPNRPSRHVELASLVHATFTPMVGGHWWRLRLHTPDHRYTLRGNGDGPGVAAALAPALGDRLAVRWLHTHPCFADHAMRSVSCLWVSGASGSIRRHPAGHPPDGLHREDAIVVAAFSFMTLLVGVIPDLIAAGLRRNQPDAPSGRTPRAATTKGRVPHSRGTLLPMSGWDARGWATARMGAIQIMQVDERDNNWEDSGPRFRAHLHGSGATTQDRTDTYDITGADVLQVIDWAQCQAGDSLTYAVALVCDDKAHEQLNPGCARGLVWLVGLDGNTNAWSPRGDRDAGPDAGASR